MSAEPVRKRQSVTVGVRNIEVNNPYALMAFILNGVKMKKKQRKKLMLIAGAMLYAQALRDKNEYCR